jgi:DICT domain-containing protein
MTLKIPASFSIYDLVDWRNIYNIFTERRKLLAHWSRTLEENVISQQLQTPVYAGFQQLRYVKPVLPRYHNMLTVTNEIFVFGVPGKADPVLSAFKCVPLRNEDQLTREWFLVVDHPQYRRALVAQEVTPPGTPHAQRLFRGVLTSDRAQIERISEGLKQAITAP